MIQKYKTKYLNLKKELQGSVLHNGCGIKNASGLVLFKDKIIYNPNNIKNQETIGMIFPKLKEIKRAIEIFDKNILDEYLK